MDEFARRCRDGERRGGRDAPGPPRVVHGRDCSRPASATVEQGSPRPALAYGLDATRGAVVLARAVKTCGVVRQRSRRSLVRARRRPPRTRRPQGPAAARVAWALEATVLTTAPSEPGALGAYPNLVIGLALGRPGVDPGGTCGARAQRCTGPWLFSGTARGRPGLFGRLRRPVPPAGAGHGL